MSTKLKEERCLRRFLRLVGRQKSGWLQYFAFAAPLHRLDHRPPIAPEKKQRGRQGKNCRGNQNHGQLAGKRYGKRIEPFVHARISVRFREGKIKGEWLAVMT